jgi:hypothetical protein
MHIVDQPVGRAADGERAYRVSRVLDAPIPAAILQPNGVGIDKAEGSGALP